MIVENLHSLLLSCDIYILKIFPFFVKTLVVQKRYFDFSFFFSYSHVWIGSIVARSGLEVSLFVFCFCCCPSKVVFVVFVERRVIPRDGEFLEKLLP